MKKLTILLLALIPFIHIGCSPKEDPEIAVSGVSVSQGSVTLDPGGSVVLTASVSPSNATSKAVSWSSSNQSVATVQNGAVTAVAEGTATITATAGGKSGSCVVTVRAKTIDVSSVTLDKTELALFEGDVAKLSTTVLPENATDKTVTWKSDNEGVVTVDGNGSVTAIKEGTANITATSGGKTATCKVTVSKKNVDVESVDLDKDELELVEGETSSLVAIVLPEDATDKSVIWVSDNEEVAAVDDNGLVTAVKEGTANITATSGGKTATCKVTVSEKYVEVESVVLDKEELGIVEGETSSLVATVLPEDATDKSVTWESDNEEVAAVDDNGLVTAVKEGTANITVKAGGKTATCKVTVSEKYVEVESISLDKEDIEIVEGETSSLVATVLPEDATDKSVTWESDNEEVAVVDGNGLVTAVKVGTAIITAKAGGKAATCEVTVSEKYVEVESISLDKEELEIVEGETSSLVATVLPEDATDKSVTWESDNEEVAVVDGNGLVTAVKVGTAIITAKAGGKITTCEVTVSEKYVEVESISLDKDDIEIVEGETSSLVATVLPEDATDKSVTWESDNEDVAVVDDDGLVTAVSLGTANITAKAGGKTATCKVTVGEKYVEVESVGLDKEELEIAEGEMYSLVATVLPEDATDKSVTWESDNKEVATVNDKGKVTAVKEGTAIITAKAGEKTATCVITVGPSLESQIKVALMEIYDAMDGPNWNVKEKWDMDKDLYKWSGVNWSYSNGIVKDFKLQFNRFGLKGEFPDCFDRLPWLNTLYVQHEPGVTGTFPQSFSKLTSLESLVVGYTSMTSMPDLFADIPLKHVDLFSNDKMSGPLPETLGSSPTLGSLSVTRNAFSGNIPDSWARLGARLNIYSNNLSGLIPPSFTKGDDAGYLINMITQATDRNNHNVFSVGDYDIPAFWPSYGLKDVVSGEYIPFKEVVKKNKATVILNWAPWCFHSSAFLPNLVKMYDKYHADGLEVIASENIEPGSRSPEAYRNSILEKNLDKWYNISEEDVSITDLYIFYPGYYIPSAIVVDSGGNIIYSDRINVNDPTRKRFGYTSSTDLLPFLEDMFGPMDESDNYSSTDYSMDGKVMTLQTAKTGKGINVVFMGDGYTDKDMGSGGVYETVMRQSMEEFFAIEPYKTFRDKFNVYAVKVVSRNGRIGEGYTTTLGSAFGEGTYVSGNEEKCFQYALMVPKISSRKNLLINVIVNSNRHAGTAFMSESNQSSVTFTSSYGNNPTYLGPVLRHEAGGHGFAFLDDEYYNYTEEPPRSYVDERNDKYKKYGWFYNIDFTDDPEKIKWSAFLSDDRYKDEVGIFQGASKYSKGIYKPSRNSMMNENVEYFNAPSRWAIYKRIMELSGETASFDKFLVYDAVNRGQKRSSAPLTRSGAKWEPTAPPVIIK